MLEVTQQCFASSPLIPFIKYNMICRFFCTLLLCGIAMCAASEETGISSGEISEVLWLQGIAKRFAPCVGPFGVNARFPKINELPPYSEMLGFIVLSDPGIVSDGYYQTLEIHGPSNTAFIVQSGGIAGTQTVYGPVPLSFQCP
ncbi:MAG: hypothetical protein V4713_13365 [Pseudomonadota bacterium]